MIKYIYDWTFEGQIKKINVVKETEKSVWYSYNLVTIFLSDCLLSRKGSTFSLTFYDSVDDLKKDISATIEKRIREREDGIVRYKSNLELLKTMQAN